MKIAIVGTGAMGSIYAARLAEAGNEVWAVDAWQAHVDAINANGLRVDGPYGKVLSKSVQATQSISDTELCDLYVVATKASGVAGCARAISDVIGTDSLVLAIQNGLGAESDLAAYLPVRQVMLGVAEGFGASMVGPGHSEHTSMKLIRLIPIMTRRNLRQTSLRLTCSVPHLISLTPPTSCSPATCATTVA